MEAEADYTPILVNDPEGPEESAEPVSDCCSVRSYTKSVAAFLPLTILTISVSVACFFPSADFFTDVFVALPAFLAKGLVESAEVQVVAIALGALIGYSYTVLSQGLWKKLSRIPKWQRAQLLIGGYFTYPVAPVIVMVEAFIGFCTGDSSLLKECKAAVLNVTQGELFECVISCVLQVKGYFVSGVDLRISLALGLCSATKGALGFDLADRTRFAITTTRGKGDAAADTEIPVVSGPLPGLTADLPRSLLLAFHRCNETCSGLMCATLFHIVAYDTFRIEILSRDVSIAGLVFVVVQTTAVATAKFMNKTSSDFFWLPLTPFCVALPLFDGYVAVRCEYAVRFLSQVVVLLLWLHTRGQDFQVVDDRLWQVQNMITAATSLSMWLSLVAVRALPLDVDMALVEQRAEMLRDAYERGERVVDVTSLFEGRGDWQHPSAQAFLRAVLASTGLDFKAMSKTKLKTELKTDFQAEMSKTKLKTDLHFLALGLSQFVNAGADDDGIAAVPETITTLTLELNNNSTITNDGLGALPKTIATLTLELNNNSTITNDGLAALPKMITTLTLNLNSNRIITNDGLAELPKTITTLTLGIYDNSTITNDGLAALPKMITILTLNLRGNRTITNDGLTALPKTTSTLTLNLRGNITITNDGLAALPKEITTLTLELDSKSTIKKEAVPSLPMTVIYK